MMPTEDQNTPLADPSGTPSAANEPILGNNSPDSVVGTATVAMAAGSRTFTDVQAIWTPDQWRTLDSNDNRNNKGYAYELVNTDVASMSVAFISGNTATTLSIVFIAGGNNQIPISFNLGDHYAIRRVEAAQDQPGMGVIEMSSADADQNTGLAVRVADKNRVLSAGNPVGWQNQQRDPCFNWNCWTGGGAIFGSGKELKMWTSLGSIKEGRDFFNSQKPAPGYGSLAGGLVVEAMSPGYPVIAAPTAAEQQCERPGFQAWTIA